MEIAPTCCVIGVGFLGIRIAGELQRLGVEVSVYDKSAFTLTKVLEELETQREELVKRGLWREEVKYPIKTYSDLKSAAERAEFIFEAIPENLELKRMVFKEITNVCKVDTIICSNTVNLEIDDISAESLFKERIMGCRFLAPVYCIPLVEICKSRFTTQETVKRLTAFLYNIDIKTTEKVIGRPLLLKKDQIVMFWKEYRKKQNSSNINRSNITPTQESDDASSFLLPSYILMRNSPQESDDPSSFFSPSSASAENSSKLILPEENKLPGKKSDPVMETLREKYPSSTPSENSSNLLFPENMLLPGEDSVSAMERLREKQALIEADERAGGM